MQKVHDAEAAVIGVDNTHTIIEPEDYVIVRTGADANSTLLKIEFSQVVWPGIFIQNRKAPGHAEMHQKAMAIIKVNQNILGPALEAYDTPALEPGREAWGKGKAQAGPAKFHDGDGPSNKDGA
jgi:hypothetical protein